MRAYDMAMCMVFINCAFPIIDLFGINTAAVASGTSVFYDIYALFSTPLFEVLGFKITGIIALAIFMAGATIVVLNTHAVTDRGIAMTVFAMVFWGSYVSASLTLLGMMAGVPAALVTFWMIFSVAATFIFINAMVQFPLGGEWGQI
jgi:hypothetical protein